MPPRYASRVPNTRTNAEESRGRGPAIDVPAASDPPKQRHTSRSAPCARNFTRVAGAKTDSYTSPRHATPPTPVRFAECGHSALPSLLRLNHERSSAATTRGVPGPCTNSSPRPRSIHRRGAGRIPDAERGEQNSEMRCDFNLFFFPTRGYSYVVRFGMRPALTCWSTKARKSIAVFVSAEEMPLILHCCTPCPPCREASAECKPTLLVGLHCCCT